MRQATARAEVLEEHARQLRRQKGWTPDAVRGQLDALSLSLRGGLSHQAWMDRMRNVTPLVGP